MGLVRDLRRVLADWRFRRLLAVRLGSQFSDGVLQVCLASYVLFSPERQPDAAAIAGALAAVLLPFSALGPFAGVFLDRWSRRQVLVGANLIRLLPVLATAGLIVADRSGPELYAAILLAFSVNRFLLAGLSASLPHVVEHDELVLANAVTPTAGTIAVITGVGVASLVRPLLPEPDPDAWIALGAAGLYLLAAGLALRIPRHLLGPDVDPERPGVREALGNAVRGLVAGLRHLQERRAAAHALAVIGAHRFGYGLATVMTILLYRNYFHDPGDTDAALAGIATAVLVSGAGYLTAAFVTPYAVTRWGPVPWMLALLSAAAVFQVMPGALFTEPAVLVAAFVLGLSAQGVKICVDTLVQTQVDDAYRGRVFSLYDVVYNVVFVAAAGVGALIIPTDGRSYGVVAVIAAVYAVTALGYARWGRRPATQPGALSP